MYRHMPTCPQRPLCHNRLQGLFNAAAAEADVDTEPFRHDLVARIRRAIADGTYETPEKWQIALDRLADALR
jgi:anti-sigma28 factor (negative regulator of flagellin synthesis)